jgi:1-acyl-sn-glycerol-3-phosphate acyltransferase
MTDERSQYLLKQQKPFVFRPPKQNSFIISLCKHMMPLILRREKIVSVDIKDEDLQRLKSLKGSRAILTANHPGALEPYILFHLSKCLDEEFNYVAAKSVFEEYAIKAWVLQRLGVYSIIQGSSDRNSFRMTRKLLVEGKRWLVIFPEGEVCWQGDTLMPFQQGVAQFAFWACDDLAELDEFPPVYLVPIAIKYIYLRDMRPQINRSLKRLESQLDLSSESQPSTQYDRLRRVGGAMLDANEKKFDISPQKDSTLDERVQNLKEHILSRIAKSLGVNLRADQPLIWRIRDVFNAFDRIAYGESEDSEYASILNQQRREEMQALYEDLWRVMYFVAVYDGYVKETLTTERMLDVLSVLELEVFKKRRIWGPKKAVVNIGAPLNARDYLSRFQIDKKAALSEVTRTLEDSVGQLLQELSRHPQ